jgi:hypothetical protein
MTEASTERRHKARPIYRCAFINVQRIWIQQTYPSNETIKSVHEDVVMWCGTARRGAEYISQKVGRYVEVALLGACGENTQRQEKDGDN